MERRRIKNEKRERAKERGFFTQSMRVLACLQVLGQLSRVLGKH